MATPTSIARYEILNRIGRGGMGALYLARDPKIDRLVAIKVLHADLDRDDMRIRFDREARSAGALNHPNIVTIFDYGVFEDAPYIVMEYLRGETLAELIKRKAPLPLADKLSLLEQLCRGLAYAHGAGIIHRDIKPANLMVDQHGVLKILDFGIARLAESGLTQMSATIGTPGYMSPEQIDGRHLERSSDVFAVGAVAYELLTGRPAFTGDSQNAIIYNVLHTVPGPVSAIVPEVGADVAAIVERCLEKTTTARYEDAADVQRDLQVVREALGGTGRTPAHLTPLSTRPGTGTGQSESLTRLTPWAGAPTGPNLMDSAREALSAGDSARALALVDRLLAIEPGQPEAVALQKEIEDARVDQLLSKARAGLVGQRFTEAGELISRALRLRPASDAALRLRAEVDERQRDAERRLGGRARAKAAVARGQQYLKDGAWDAARRAADEAWALDPQNEDVIALMQAADAGIQDGAGALFSNGEMVGAELLDPTVPMGGTMPGPVMSSRTTGARQATTAGATGVTAGHVGAGSPRRGLWVWLMAAAGVITVGVLAVTQLTGVPKPPPPPSDATPPVVVLASPLPGEAVKGEVRIRAVASDDIGVVGVTVAVDGAQVADLKAPPYDYSWASANLADGPHTISVDAADAAGHHTFASVSVTSSNAPAPATKPVPPPDAAPRTLSPEQQSQITKLLDRADQDLNTGKYEDAMAEIRQALKINARDARALQLQKDSNAAVAAEKLKKGGRGGGGH